MTESTADHIWGAVTFVISLFVKDWAQRWPVVKWIWPRAWDEAQVAKHKTINGSSDAEGLPMTDRVIVPSQIKDILAQAERIIRSGLIEREQENQMLTKLEALADSLKAREEALSTCCERFVIRERMIRLYVSNVHKILDRGDQ